MALANFRAQEVRDFAGEEDRDLESLAAMAARWRRLYEFKPRRLGAFLLKAFGPWERRRIAITKLGIRLYLDPFTGLGQQLLLDGTYEPETVDILHRQLSPGKVFLDVGANEGFYSVLAGRLVGPSGLVIAVEPQRACRSIIEINLCLNQVAWSRIYLNAMGGPDGQSGTLLRYASVNTGLSSIVSRYRSTTGTEEFRFVSFERILRENDIPYIDLAKVDVEGFEFEVTRSLIPHIQERKIKALLVEYHPRILASRAISPLQIHSSLIECGTSKTTGDPQAPDGQGRVLYEFK
jgi:FkbM family methyltransferase